MVHFSIAALLLLASSSGQPFRAERERVKDPARIASISVKARLDFDGVLHVTEREVLRVSGTTDGAMRVFDLPLGSDIAIHYVRRVSGESLELRRGDLTEPGQYTYHNPSALLWRFTPRSDQSEEVFEIGYTLSKAMRLAKGGYSLDWKIGPPSLTPEVEFELDPVWQAEGGFPPSGKVVRIRDPAAFSRTIFRYKGPGQPRFAPHPVPAGIRLAILTAVGVAFALLTLIFIVSEVRVGAFSAGAEVPP